MPGPCEIPALRRELVRGKARGGLAERCEERPYSTAAQARDTDSHFAGGSELGSRLRSRTPRLPARRSARV